MLLSFVQPASDAAAQTVTGGGNLTIVSLASATDPASRQVGLLFNPGNAQASYQLVRVTSNASGNATTAIPNPVGVIGSQNFFIDTVPAGAGNAACYRVVPLNAAGTAIGSSDMVCIILGTASGTVPGNTRMQMNQGPNGNFTWDPTPGAASYIVWGLGTDGVQVTPGTSATLPGNGGLICGIVLAVDAGGRIIGASNILCGFPGFSSNVGGSIPVTPPTATRTNTVIAVATNTNTTVPTNTLISTNTIIPTNTIIATSTGTNTTVPTLTAISTNTAGATNTLLPTSTLVPTSTNTGTPLPSSTPTITSTPTVTSTPLPVDLALVKSANPSVANAGGTITYTLSITNVGGTDAQGVLVTDALPGGLNFLAGADRDAAGFVCGASQGVVACNGGRIARGATARVDITALIDNPCNVVSPVRNVAVVNPNGTISEISTDNNRSEIFTTIIGCVQATNTPTTTGTRTPVISRTPTNTPSVDLTISKNGSPNPVANGDTLTYTIQVGNGGTFAAVNVTVVDYLDTTNLQYLSSAGDNGFDCTFAAAPAGSPANSPGRVTCTGATVGQNGGATITIVARRITADPCSSWNFDPISGTLVGEGVTGTILNKAQIDPSNTIAEFNEGNNVAEFRSTCGVAGVNTITPAAVTRTPTRTATITATAVAAPDFTFTKTGPARVEFNQPFTYTLTLRNNLGVPVSGINLTDPLPSEAQFVGVAASGGGFNCRPNAAQTTVVCTGGTLQGGETITILIDVVSARACGVSPFTNTASITSPQVANNTASVSTTFDACGTPSPTGTSTNTATATASVTVTGSLTATPSITNTVTVTRTVTNTAIPTTTRPPADLDTAGYEGNDTGLFRGATFTSQRVITLVSDGTQAISGISFVQNITGTNTTITGVTVVMSGGTVSGTCTPAGAGNNRTVTCTGINLAPNDNIGPGINCQDPSCASPDTYVAVITVTGTTTQSATNATIVYAAAPVTCTNPGACTDNTVSPANGDGGPTTIPADTDTIAGGGADLDTRFCPDTTLAGCQRDAANDADAGGVENIALPGTFTAQDLDPGPGGGNGFNAVAIYILDNDGVNAITNAAPTNGVSFTGSIDPTSTAVFSGGNVRGDATFRVIPTGGQNFTCTPTNTGTALTYTCQGNLAADSGGVTDEVAVYVAVSAPSGTSGQTVIFRATAPACNAAPGPCIDGQASPANVDGSDLTPGTGNNSFETHRDTLQ